MIEWYIAKTPLGDDPALRSRAARKFMLYFAGSKIHIHCKKYDLRDIASNYRNSPVKPSNASISTCH
jgi:hypothetical protein